MHKTHEEISEVIAGIHAHGAEEDHFFEIAEMKEEDSRQKEMRARRKVSENG